MDTKSPPPYESYWAFFRDVAIAMVLFIVACQIAHVLAHNEYFPLPYLMAFSIGMGPMWWFLKRCQIHNYSWWDYGVLCLGILTAAGVGSLLEGVLNHRALILLQGLIASICFSSWLKLRAKFRPIAIENN